MGRRRDIVLHATIGAEKITTRVHPDHLPMVKTLIVRYITGEFKSGEIVERLFIDPAGDTRRFKAQFTLEQALEYRRQLTNRGYWT